MNLNQQNSVTHGLRGLNCAAAAMCLLLTSGHAVAARVINPSMNYETLNAQYGQVTMPQHAALCLGGASASVLIQGIDVGVMGGMATEYRQVVTADFNLYRYDSRTGTWPLYKTQRQESPSLRWGAPGPGEGAIPLAIFPTSAGFYHVKVVLTWWFAFQDSYWLAGSSKTVEFNVTSDYTADPSWRSSLGPDYCGVY